MNKVVAIMLLVTFFPLQVCADSFDGFRTNTQYEMFYERPKDPPKELPDNALRETLLEGKHGEVKNSPYKWYLWGGVGLAVVIAVVAVVAGGSSKKDSPGAPALSTVKGSW